jgi:hypothetical protein
MNTIIPNQLKITINTDIPGFQNIKYKPYMTLPNNKTDDSVQFNPLVEIKPSIIKSLPKDVQIKEFLNKGLFQSLINSHGLVRKKTLDEATRDGYVDNNIKVTLDSLFPTNSVIYINKQPYAIADVQWTKGDWKIGPTGPVPTGPVPTAPTGVRGPGSDPTGSRGTTRRRGPTGPGRIRRALNKTAKFANKGIGTAAKFANKGIGTAAKFADKGIGTAAKFADKGIGTAAKFANKGIGTAAKFANKGIETAAKKTINTSKGIGRAVYNTPQTVRNLHKRFKRAVTGGAGYGPSNDEYFSNITGGAPPEFPYQSYMRNNRYQPYREFYREPFVSIYNKNKSILDAKTNKSYYITIDMDLQKGTSLSPKDLSNLRCRKTWNSVRKSYSDLRGLKYSVKPDYNKLPTSSREKTEITSTKNKPKTQKGGLGLKKRNNRTKKQNYLSS